MKISRTPSIMGLLLFFCGLLQSQIPMEPRASLQANIEKEPHLWFEGYTRTLRGTQAPYESHRSNGRRDSAVVIRTNETDQSLEWQTENVPLTPNGEAYRFLWTCGFGSNQGKEAFDLVVNGRNAFSFVTTADSEWTVTGKNGGLLSFTLMGLSQYGASLGYMTLEVPSSWCESGKPLSIQIKPRSSPVEVWYRLYQYQYSLHYFLKQEKQSVYTVWRHINFGDAILTVVAPRSLEGTRVLLKTVGGELATGTTVRYDNVARAEIGLTRTQERLLKTPIIVQIGEGIIDTVAEPDLEERRIKAFMEEDIVFDRYFFPPGNVPSAAWKNPARVKNLIGNTDLKIGLFNASFEKVQSAETPGRYGALIECVTSSGFAVRRFATLFCVPTNANDWMKGLTSAENNLWTDYQREEIGRYLSGKSSDDFFHDQDAAIFFAGLSTMSSGKQWNDSPRIRDRQWWIDFKRIVLGNAPPPVLFHPPRTEGIESGSILREIDPFKSGYHPEDIAEIRRICALWTEQGGEPIVTIVAHDGDIIFYEAFGKNIKGESASKTTPMWMASITKLLTGALMMQFVDQGLIDLDVPVSTYLMELSNGPLPVLTVRDLFTHTNGFGWHGEWASDWNMSLENYLAQCFLVCHVREKHQYNRMGYAVAGKIMERLTGKSIPALFYENLLMPLGMANTVVDNTYGSCTATAFDIALLGQMLLNKGRFNGKEFFSENTFERMLPQAIEGPKGRLEPDWGIGTAWLGGSGLSKKTFGHEAASGALLRIDPELRLVLVSARDRIGPNYSLYESFKNRLLSAVAIAIKNRQKVQ